MKFFKNKGKKQKEVAQEPREFTVLQAESQKLYNKAGELQYLIEIKKLELNDINQMLLNLGREAATRQELDRKAKEQAPQETVQ